MAKRAKAEAMDGAAWQNRIVGEGVQPADQFMAHPDNWRIHGQAQRRAMGAALEKVGWVQRVIVNRRTGHLLDGHERVWQALRKDNAKVPFVEVDLSEEEEAYVLATFDPIGAMAMRDEEALQRLLAKAREDDAATMAALLQEGAGDDLERLASGKLDGDPVDAQQEVRIGSLAERFGVPPFTVLDGRQGYWQDRTRAWLKLGIQSELGRGIPGKGLGAIPDNEDNLLGFSSQVRSHYKPATSFGAQERLNDMKGNTRFQTGTSIFSPVLCELAYRWFSAQGHRVLDPFAGGSVRGIVAGMLGREYVGIDLSERQVEANRIQADDIIGDEA